MKENNTLAHYGILGMKWGVRKDRRARSGRARSETHEDYKKAHEKKSVKSMSDAELRNRNNRLLMEQQYAELSKKSRVGQRAAKEIIATAGTITALTGAYKTFKAVGAPIADKAISKIGDYVISGITM